MRNTALAGAAIAFAAALAACAGGGHSLPASPTNASGTAAPAGSIRGTASIVLKIPGSKKPMSSLKRGVKYIPTATDTMQVVASGNGVTMNQQTFSLAANSSLCVADVNGDGGRSCTANVIAPIGTNDSFDVTLEEVTGQQTPLVLAHAVLSGQAIVEGAANAPTIPLTLGGVVFLAYITVGPVTSFTAPYDTLFSAENAPSGIPINVHAEDASYETIIGPYDTSEASAEVYLATPDYGGYIDGQGNNANNHVFTSSSDQVYYVPSATTGNGADLNSLGDALLLETITTTGSGAGQQSSISYSETYYTPSQITSTPVVTAVATGPFTTGASLTNASYTTANGGIATFSDADPSLYPTQQCASYVDSSGTILPIAPTSAVNVNNQGGFQGYALASNVVYALSPASYATPPPNLTAPVCQASPLPSSAANLGSLRNLTYNRTSDVLVLNSDAAPVVAIQYYSSGNPNWDAIPYSSYEGLPAPSASFADGLVSDPNSSVVYFTDSTAGVVGVADVSESVITQEFSQATDSSIVPPLRGLAVDDFGDVGFTANNGAYVFNAGTDDPANYEPPQQLGYAGAAVIGGAFSALGSLEGNSFQQYFTLDSAGTLTSFAFAPDPNTYGASFTYGATSTTPVGTATAITAFPNSPLFIATANGITQYPSEGVFLENSDSIHRRPAARKRGVLAHRR